MDMPVDRIICSSSSQQVDTIVASSAPEHSKFRRVMLMGRYHVCTRLIHEQGRFDLWIMEIQEIFLNRLYRYLVVKILPGNRCMNLKLIRSKWTIRGRPLSGLADLHGPVLLLAMKGAEL